MNNLSDDTANSPDLKYILDAVINLYAAHINSVMYAYTNPLISDLLKNAHYCWVRLSQKTSYIR